MSKTFIFIDGNHLFYSLKQHNKVEIDYTRLVALLSSMEGKAHRVFFYTGVDKDHSSFERQTKFFRWLTRNGFQVTAKQVELNGQGNKSVDYKPELLTDLAIYGTGADTVILVSGIEDYNYCLQRLGERGVRTVVAAFEGLISSKLLDTADSYINLKHHVAEIRKTSTPTTSGHAPAPSKRGDADWHEMDEDDFVTGGLPPSPYHPVNSPLVPDEDRVAPVRL